MIIDFLQTSRSAEELKVALTVVREFSACQSHAEFLRTPELAWLRLRQLEEFLAHLVNGTPLADDTARFLAELDQVHAAGRKHTAED